MRKAANIDYRSLIGEILAGGLKRLREKRRAEAAKSGPTTTAGTAASAPSAAAAGAEGSNGSKDEGRGLADEEKTPTPPDVMLP